MRPSRAKLPATRPFLVKLTGRSVELPPKQADAYYRTEGHLQWRRMVIERAGFACERCGAERVRLFADHIKELRDGGDPLDLANGWALCGACHSQKTYAEKRARMVTYR